MLMLTWGRETSHHPKERNKELMSGSQKCVFAFFRWFFLLVDINEADVGKSWTNAVVDISKCFSLVNKAPHATLCSLLFATHPVSNPEHFSKSTSPST